MLAPKDTDTERAEHLMAGKGEEIGSEFLHVYLHMGNGLCAVDDHDATSFMSTACQFCDGVLNAQDVGYLCGRDDLGVLDDLGIHLFFGDDAVCIGVKVDQLSPSCAANLLPRYEVRVMLHDGDAHLVAFVEVGHAVGFCNQVQRLAGVAAEHDVACLRCIDEFRASFARLVDRGSGLNRKAIQASQGVRVHRLVEVTLGIEHARGALRRCRAI